MEKMEERKSNIELLKLIAIVLIIVSHSVPFYGPNDWPSFTNLDVSGTSLEHIILLFLRALGQFGNAIFIVCSAYFLVDSKKIRISKIIRIVLDTTIISLFLFWIIGIKLNYGYDRVSLVSSIFPTIYRENYWFICCYLILYLIHPLLNIINNNLSKRKMLLLNLCMIMGYSIINIIYDKTFFYTELIGFIELYFLVAYMKKYLGEFSKSKYKNLVILIISIALEMIFILVINTLGTKIKYYNGKMQYWTNISNPFIILIAISLLNIFCNFNFKNKLINMISSTTLLVYVISDNYFIREKLKPKFFYYYYGIKPTLYLIGMEIIRSILFSFVCAIIYKFTIQLLTTFLAEKLDILVNKKR